jgi:hypothetical protein
MSISEFSYNIRYFVALWFDSKINPIGVKGCTSCLYEQLRSLLAWAFHVIKTI